MGKAPEVQLQIMGQEEGELAACVEQTTDSGSNSRSSSALILMSKRRSCKWWLLIAVYIILTLEGQSVATLLGRLYYTRGGKSKWMGALVQSAGFPVLVPLWYLSVYRYKFCCKPDNMINPHPSSLSVSVHIIIYVVLGILQAGNCLLYSLGLNYLPVSTYSLICSSQLGFNALFSFLLNSQKSNFYIINSIILLTISSTLLVFQKDSSGSDNSFSFSKEKYAVGFVCTVAASAGEGLILSLTQLCFQKVFKEQTTFKVILDMIIYPALVATLITVVALFAVGNANSLGAEMDKFELGKLSYVMVLVWTAIHWQIFSIGALGLIFEISSLFSNVIAVLGLPLVPIMAILLFQDSMSGVKAISMVLAIWGFVSYVYQQHLDHINY